MLKPRYHDLPFTREQVDTLQVLLEIKDHEQALQVARLITVALFNCLVAHKLEFPNAKSARRRLGRIHALASHLATLLQAAPEALDLIGLPPHSRPADQTGFVGMLASYNSGETSLQALITTLKLVSDNAIKIRPNNLTYRTIEKTLSTGFDEGSKKAPNAISRELWPPLFETWELSGRKVSGECDGLRDFISLVHQVAGLDTPKASTLSEALQAWTTENPERKFQGFPPRLRRLDQD